MARNPLAIRRHDLSESTLGPPDARNGAEEGILQELSREFCALTLAQQDTQTIH